MCPVVILYKHSVHYIFSSEALICERSKSIQNPLPRYIILTMNLGITSHSLRGLKLLIKCIGILTHVKYLRTQKHVFMYFIDVICVLNA